MKVGDVILFRYQGGTHKDEQRVLEVQHIGNGYISGHCRLTNAHRQFFVEQMRSTVVIKTTKKNIVGWQEIRQRLVERLHEMSVEQLAAEYSRVIEPCTYVDGAFGIEIGSQQPKQIDRVRTLTEIQDNELNITPDVLSTVFD